MVTAAPPAAGAVIVIDRTAEKEPPMTEPVMTAKMDVLSILDQPAAYRRTNFAEWSSIGGRGQAG